MFLCFRERSDKKAQKCPPYREDTIAERVLLRNKDGHAETRFSSSISPTEILRHPSDTFLCAPQLRRRRVIGRWSRAPREIAWPEMCSSRRKNIYGTLARPEYMYIYIYIFIAILCENNFSRAIFFIGEDFRERSISERYIVISRKALVIRSKDLFSHSDLAYFLD